uniref:Coenzyme PQQ synthesis protein F-like C-terminal lobe domain-containing protein n=1 Tax=Timema genevievae TaxID=629358 RepID=A0A7R9K432_TIMGE|nr:unnamed protein product [Timema genevievae]
MVTFEESLTEEIFDALKEQESRNYFNNFLKPSKLSRDLRLAILLQSHWTNVDKHTMCHKIDLQMMKSFSKQLLEQLYIQSLVQGNVLEQDALDACSNIVDILKFGLLLPNSRPQMRVVKVPLGEIYSRIPSFNEEDSNSLITNYYQSEPGSIKNTCIIELLMMLMEECQMYTNVSSMIVCYQMLMKECQMYTDVSCMIVCYQMLMEECQMYTDVSCMIVCYQMLMVECQMYTDMLMEECQMYTDVSSMIVCYQMLMKECQMYTDVSYMIVCYQMLMVECQMYTDVSSMIVCYQMLMVECQMYTDMLMEEPLFNNLRTKEQLGYSISCELRDTFGILGFTISVNTQANKHSADYIDERIEEFLKTFLKFVETLPSEDLKEVRNSIIKLKQSTDLYLREEVTRNWHEIINQEYVFDRRTKEVVGHVRPSDGGEEHVRVQSEYKQPHVGNTLKFVTGANFSVELRVTILVKLPHNTHIEVGCFLVFLLLKVLQVLQRCVIHRWEPLAVLIEVNILTSVIAPSCLFNVTANFLEEGPRHSGNDISCEDHDRVRSFGDDMGDLEGLKLEQPPRRAYTRRVLVQRVGQASYGEPAADVVTTQVEVIQNWAGQDFPRAVDGDYPGLCRTIPALPP